MISDEAMRDIRACVQSVIDDDAEPERYKVDYERALDELETAQQRAREQVVAADPDPEFVQRVIDVTLVEDAIRRHAVIMLMNMGAAKKPLPGDVFPTYQTAIAQWHLARIVALRAAPVDLAAKMLREEALAALTPTTKEPPV